MNKIERSYVLNPIIVKYKGGKKKEEGNTIDDAIEEARRIVKDLRPKKTVEMPKLDRHEIKKATKLLDARLVRGLGQKDAKIELVGPPNVGNIRKFFGWCKKHGYEPHVRELILAVRNGSQVTKIIEVYNETFGRPYKEVVNVVTVKRFTEWVVES